MQSCISMPRLRPGEKAFVKELVASDSMRRRFLDIGLVAHTPVECLGRSPGGDPSAFLIRGAVIAIRAEDCADLLLTR